MAKASTLLWEDQNSKRFKVSDFFILKKEKNIQFKLVHLLLHDINGEWKPQDLMGLLGISTLVAYSLDASCSQSKSKYTKTNKQIHKYKYTNTNTQIQRYIYTNINTHIAPIKRTQVEYSLDASKHNYTMTEKRQEPPNSYIVEKNSIDIAIQCKRGEDSMQSVHSQSVCIA